MKELTTFFEVLSSGIIKILYLTLFVILGLEHMILKENLFLLRHSFRTNVRFISILSQQTNVCSK